MTNNSGVAPNHTKNTKVGAKVFSTPMRVYIEDTDAGGVVYYVNYLKFMERARTDYLRSLGFAKPALITDDSLLVVASANIEYKISARLDDILHVSAVPQKIARSYVVITQTVQRSGDNGALLTLAHGEVKVVCVNRHSMRPTAMPEALYKALLNDQREIDT